MNELIDALRAGSFLMPENQVRTAWDLYVVARQRVGRWQGEPLKVEVESVYGDVWLLIGSDGFEFWNGTLQAGKHKTATVYATREGLFGAISGTDPIRCAHGLKWVFG